jgi:prophage DNA circulation protein
MAAITSLQNPWRDRLRPASFRGAGFNVETSGKSSGRRTVLHEYPKRDIPFAEDMGRRAKRFRINGFLIGRDYLTARDKLITALEAEGPGILIHPSLPQLEVMCEGYTVEETRERGGYCSFDMTFVEHGVPGFELLNRSDSSGETIEPAATASSTEDSTALDATLSESHQTIQTLP